MPVRVMLVDDAVVVRRVLQDSLQKDPELEIVAVAKDGIDALDKIAAARPDVVVLDIEMPNMDGVETLGHIKRQYPNVRVVMFSTLTSHGAEATLDALSMGADDYVTKPSNTAGLTDAMARINLQLVPKIKALAPRQRNFAAAPASAPSPLGAPPRDRFSPRPTAPAAAPAPAAPGRPAQAVGPTTPASVRPASGQRIDVVVIAISTGGPNALMELMPLLPRDFPAPIVLVQHIPPVFSKALADRLNARSALEVAEAFDNCPVTPGRVWIAPGDHHVTFAKLGTAIALRTNQGPPENSCRPAADILFRSAAETFGPNVLGAVLTGMGYDGTKGSEAIVAAGGTVIAQDQATSVVWGMPGSVVEHNLASGVYPLKQIATEFTTRVGAAHRRASVTTGRTQP